MNLGENPKPSTILEKSDTLISALIDLNERLQVLSQRIIGPQPVEIKNECLGPKTACDPSLDDRLNNCLILSQEAMRTTMELFNRV